MSCSGANPITSTRRAAGALIGMALGVATLVACRGGGEPPEIDPLGRQLAQVGVQLSLTLTATDADGDELTFRFASTIPDIQQRAQLTRSPSGAAIWRWTPLAADEGIWFVDFTASDGSHEATLTVEIEVRSAIGGSGAPVFRQPLGTGTTLDLRQRQCVEVPVVVEDQDSTSVVLTQEEPVIEGATLTSTGGLTATWRWCPSRDQAIADPRWTLTLAADDLTHPKTLKNYLIVLRDGDGAHCPGDAPVILHTPQNLTTLNGLTLDARITDDLGLKQSPLLYYALSDPGASPDLGSMIQVSMLHISGTMRDGVWAADVPNPVVGTPQGTTRTLYYVIVADDDDDPAGDCDHVTQSAVYSMTVTNPGGSGSVGLCGACTADLQCGGGLCVRVGAMNEPFCLADCASTADCAAGYTCSASPVTSVNGASRRQCVPDSGSCGGSATCQDDWWEDNDNRTQAAANGPIWPDLYELTSCPLPSGGGDDEDFFELQITTDSLVTLEISGETTTDLDLALQSATGTLIAASTSYTSDERIERCLTPGTYYARVYAWGIGRNDYLLSYERRSQSCASACVDDANEPDNTMAQARPTIFPVHTSTGQTICNDDDWYRVPLFNGEKLIVDLTFTQSTPQQDLDLHFHDAAGTNLTPCYEPNGETCTVANGQSATSNEHFEFTAPATGCASGCTYYVRVHGWAGSKNTYAIRIAIE
jgi:hypothetical protein